jgi:PAP2 superfamily
MQGGERIARGKRRIPREVGMQRKVRDGKYHVAKVLLTLLLILCGLVLGLGRQFYDEAIVDAFFALALASVVIIHLRTRPRWLDVVLIAVGTAFLAAVDFHTLHYPTTIMAWFSFLGLSSFVIMGVRSIWEQERRFLLYAWVPAALFVVSDYFASTMLQWTTKAHPKTFDLYLLSFDGSLRVQLAFAVGRYYARLDWLHIIALIGYVGLAVPIAVVYVGRLIRFKERAFSSMLAFLIAGPMGILFYNLFPACGPHSLFGQAFPFHSLPIANLSRLALEPVAIPGARNAMPSLHLAWTLLAWWYSKGLSWIERFIAFAFLGLTALATLGTGEHWFVDLVVAFPFALMIQAICAYDVSSREPTRITALVLGLGGTLAWLVTLRYGTKLVWTSPIVPWALVVATIALISIRQAKLDRVANFEKPTAAGRSKPSTSPLDHTSRLVGLPGR